MEDKKEIIVLGVTGGIASGKSTVTSMLGDLGAATISADAIAHELTAPGAPLTVEVLKAFGNEYAVAGKPQTLDRAKIGALVFADAEARKKLESITHPPIIAEQERRVTALKEAGSFKLIALEIPLLFEAGMAAHVDKVLVAYSGRKTQIARMTERNPSMPLEEIEARIDAQMPLAEKARQADFMVDTDQPLDDVHRELAGLFDKLTAGKV
jgi:dephospho-CoA kinase